MFSIDPFVSDFVNIIPKAEEYTKVISSTPEFDLINRAVSKYTKRKVAESFYFPEKVFSNFSAQSDNADKFVKSIDLFPANQSTKTESRIANLVNFIKIKSERA